MLRRALCLCGAVLLLTGSCRDQGGDSSAEAAAAATAVAPPAAPPATTAPGPSSAPSSGPTGAAGVAVPIWRQREERFDYFLGGARSGRHLAVDRLDASGNLELLRQTEFVLRRGEEVIRLTIRSVSVVDPSLRPLRFYSVREEGVAGPVRIEGVVRGQTVEITSTAGGATTRSSVVLPAGATFAAALDLKSRHQLRDGASYTGKTLLEETGGLVDVNYRVQGSTAGFTITARFAGIEQLTRLDREGRTLRLEVPSMNAYAAPAGATPQPIDAPLDVIARTNWPAPEDIPPAAQLAAATFRVDGKLAKPVPEGRYQRRLEGRPGMQLVRVERAPRGKPEPLSAAARAHALGETPYEPLQDPRITRTAAQVTRGATDAAEKVTRLVRFVYEKIKDKGLSRAYASAPETLESEVGDCTEHSVLFSALAKVSGIPTRLADGVVITDGKIAYHEWVEVYLEGEGWRPVDPTFGEAHAGPNRLKLANGSSRPEDLLQMGLASAAALTGIEISVIAHEAIER